MCWISPHLHCCGPTRSQGIEGDPARGASKDISLRSSFQYQAEQEICHPPYGIQKPPTAVRGPVRAAPGLSSSPSSRRRQPAPGPPPTAAPSRCPPADEAPEQAGCCWRPPPWPPSSSASVSHRLPPGCAPRALPSAAVALLGEFWPARSRLHIRARSLLNLAKMRKEIVPAFKAGAAAEQPPITSACASARFITPSRFVAGFSTGLARAALVSPCGLSQGLQRHGSGPKTAELSPCPGPIPILAMPRPHCACSQLPHNLPILLPVQGRGSQGRQGEPHC